MRNSIKMNKLKHIIAELLKNEKIKIFFNNVIHLIKGLKQHVVINNLINKTVNFVKQHKAISVAIAVSVVVIPPLIAPTSYYPKECKGYDVSGIYTPAQSADCYSYANASSPNLFCGGAKDSYVSWVKGPHILRKLVSEEDPELSFASESINREAIPQQTIYEYDEQTLTDLFNTKYSKLVKTEGKEAAEKYRKQAINSCNDYEYE